MPPELSLLEVPVAKMSFPELPEVPAFSDLIVTDPLVVVVLLPDVSVTAPPVLDAALVWPALRSMAPPTPASPDPPVIWMAPPAPFVAAPDPMSTEPVWPELDVPVLNTSLPLDPLTPALTECIVTLPEEVAVPTPPRTRTAPPASALLTPAVS
jgi:hypothetical protein